MKPKSYPTDEAANILGLRPDTLRAALCRNGHWCGIRPIKLPNRRLLWPADQVDALLAESAQTLTQ